VIVPVAVAQTVMVSLLRIAAFTLGIVFAMSAYGLLAGGVLQHFGEAADSPQRQRLAFHLATGGVGVFCIIAGLITLGERLHS